MAALAFERGQSAEAFVAQRLEREGWCVLARNWRAAAGELDLVVERGGALRFVEVKARTPDGEPEEAYEQGLESIGTNKQRRLRAAANAWLELRGLPEREAAFLVAAVSLDGCGWTVEWWDDAF